jgi:hypothetical protein
MTQGLLPQGLPTATRVGNVFTIEVVVAGTPPANACITLDITSPGHNSAVPLREYDDAVDADEGPEMASFIFGTTHFTAGAGGKTWTFTFKLWADADQARNPGVQPMATLTHDISVN